MSTREEKLSFARLIADYVETGRDYELIDKRQAVIEAVLVLLEDIGAAQRYLQAIGVPYDLYEPERTPLVTPELHAVVEALHKKTIWTDQDGRIGLAHAWLEYKQSEKAKIDAYRRLIEFLLQPVPDIKYGEHKWGAFA